MGYTVIYRSSSDDGAIEKSTPKSAPGILFETIQVSRNADTGETYLQTRLRNVSSRTVVSLKGSVLIEYADGSEETAGIDLPDLRLSPGESIDPSPIVLRGGEISRASGTIDHVDAEEALTGEKPAKQEASMEAVEAKSAPVKEAAAKERAPKAEGKKDKKPQPAFIAAIVCAVIAIGVVFALFIAPSLDHSAYIVSRMVYHGDSTTESVYTLDDHGNKITKTSDGKTSEFTCDDNGFCTHVQSDNPLDLTIEESDSAGRPTKIRSHSSSANTDVHYEYDYYDSGVLKSRSTSATTSGLSIATTENYNENGFTTSLQASLSAAGKTSTSSSTYTYDGDQAHPSGYTKTDEKGAKTTGTYTYDENGCITQVTEGGKVKYEFEYTKVANPSLSAQILANTPGILELSHL